MDALGDAQRTTVVLVSLPDARPLDEAARAAAELATLGLTRQRLILNGVFHATLRDDVVARALEAQGQRAIAHLPAPLDAMPRDEVSLRPNDMVGLPALRAVWGDAPPPATAAPTSVSLPAEALPALTDALEQAGHGLVMVMGKGGVGKTTLAAALAVALARRGHRVHLTTTDPAAHLAATVAGAMPGLEVSRIDPVVETQRYIDKMLATRGKDLDAPGRALLLEDLRSPCTEEVAVFHAFSRVIREARDTFVVLDTAPTGHALLLMDATGAYHRQTMRSLGSDQNPSRITTPLMRLQDPTLTRVVVVTLPETTPVSQAAALQEDLRRAHVEPFAWIVNRSLAASGTKDPLLTARLEGERRQFARIAAGLARRVFVIPWLPTAPVGVEALAALGNGR
jgi:arsenite-transporting ATPase